MGGLFTGGRLLRVLDKVLSDHHFEKPEDTLDAVDTSWSTHSVLQHGHSGEAVVHSGSDGRIVAVHRQHARRQATGEKQQRHRNANDWIEIDDLVRAATCHMRATRKQMSVI